MVLLSDSQKVVFSIQPVDAKGYPARIDGAPSWNVSNPSVGQVVVMPDGLSAEFVAGLPGMCQVSVVADADLGSGVRLIAGTLDVQVEPGEAVGLTINAGVPTQA